MALTRTSLSDPIADELVVLKAEYSASDAVGTQISGSSSALLFAVDIDNTLNTSASYVKLYDGSPTVGTTAPVGIFKAAASVRVQYTITLGLTYNAPYATVVNTSGTAGVKRPTNTVIARFLISSP